MPGDDIFYLDFLGVNFNASSFVLEDFVNLTGVRLQSLPEDIVGEGSLFLAGQTQIPEPATIFLTGVGLLGLGAFIRKKTKDKE